MSNQVALTILNQLGGRLFVAMTGATCLSDKDSLIVKLPSRFSPTGINHLTVKLTEDDLYTMTFGKVRGLKYTVVSEFSGVYWDQLQEIFARETGLECSIRR